MTEAQATRYRSRFGGLWTDLSNAAQVIERKHASKLITDEEATLLSDWIRDGFVVLRQAVPHALIDRLDADIEDIWNGTSSRRGFVEVWEDGMPRIRPASRRFREERVKLLDVYTCSQHARQVIFSEPILRFLDKVFERPVVAFQSLYFRWGSRQDIHQDTAFVKVSSPLEFVASWVALEDVRPDSGELEYYVGSHALDDYLFADGQKWMPLPFNAATYDAFIQSLAERSRHRGLRRERFLPKKGDVLIWSADLAHGGSKESSPGVTRKSLVTHYCPRDCSPVYGLPSGRRRRYSETASYSVPIRPERFPCLAVGRKLAHWVARVRR